MNRVNNSREYLQREIRSDDQRQRNESSQATRLEQVIRQQDHPRHTDGDARTIGTSGRGPVGLCFQKPNDAAYKTESVEKLKGRQRLRIQNEINKNSDVVNDDHRYQQDEHGH